ncbi:hypothetical protein LCM20_15345 [Halobacillus litoralis]|uniref:hypothetical protein n=1 Tax=Halobacillus litoralis TaxID=45668 RepID=UPI001CD2DB59|nr:hypothetical protein [Halobacillus litoralis]MCA0971980.1 hypothetical protein [Halobacillus litoralis]
MGSIYMGIIIVVSLFALVSTFAIAMNQTKLQSASSAEDDIRQLMAENQPSNIPLLVVIYGVFFVLLTVLISLFVWF